MKVTVLSLTHIELISNTIRIDISDEVKCTNIELSAAIIKEKPDLELLCDIIMNEPRLGLFSLREKNVPVSMKIKYSIYTKLGVVTFRRGENKSVVISNIKKEEHIDGAIEQVLLLLDVYEEVREKFSRLYNVISEEEKASKHRTRTFALKEEVPELFVAGYARECSIKPIIITKLEKEKYESEGRPTMKYPLDGKYSRIYACDAGFYPGLRKNRLSNKNMFEFLPCCYVTDHLKRSESNYYKYVHGVFDAGRNNKTIVRFKPLHPLGDGFVGKAPKELQELIRSTNLIRVGVRRDKSSALSCILRFTSRNIPRKQLSFPPQICLQELWYLTEDEILLNARDDNVFLDPTLYCRVLEYIFSANVYVLDVYDDTSIRMSIPRTKGPYIWQHEYAQSIIILCHRHLPSYPQCELIAGHWSDTIRQFKQQITICNEALQPKNYTKQKINESGKCISVFIGDRWEECFWRPLDVERVEIEQTSISISTHEYRLRAYFIHDLYLMCKRWNVVRVKFVDDNILFTPKIMRETFSSSQQFVNYYSSRYSCLFGNGILRVTLETYERLTRCNNGLMVFPLIVTAKEFTRRRNNIVTITNRSEDEKIKLCATN